MFPNFKEILLELSYRVPEGIIDLTKPHQISQLIQVLKEHKVSSPTQLAQNASKWFALLKEDEIVKNKKTGNVYTVKNFNPDTHSKPTPAEIDKAKKSGDLKTEPTPNIFDKEKEEKPKIKSDFSELETNNKNSLDSFIQNGFANSSGAPGSAGSMLNEIISITSATDTLNSNSEFNYDSQLKSNVEKLKGTFLAKENDSDNPASGVKKSEAMVVAKENGVSIGVASKAIIATRAAESKHNHVKKAIIEKNGIKDAKSIPFFGDKSGLKSQENAVNSAKGRILLGNTEISKEDAIQIIRNSGGGDNPSDTAIFVINNNTDDLHMTFYSDKDNVNAIVAQSSLVAETQFKKKQIDSLIENRNLTKEEGEKIKTVMDDTIKEYQKLETDLDKIVSEPILHLQTVDPDTLVDLTKSLSKGANADKYWNGDKSTKGVAQVMTKSKKHIAYLPDGHSNPPTNTEIIQGFIKYASDARNTLTKTEQRIISDLSNKTDGPKLGAKIGEIRKKTVETDLNLIRQLDKQKITINETTVGIGTLLEAESVSEKLHLNMMFGGSGVYSDPDAFYQESGGVAVNKQTMQKCLPFDNKDDMVSHFEVGEERETTKRGETTITGGSKIVYAISKNGQKYPIGEKIQRSKTGVLGKLQTVYKYHPDVQKCFSKNG